MVCWRDTMCVKIYFCFLLTSARVMSLSCHHTSEGSVKPNKPNVAKIEYGKHYVTRIFPAISDRTFKDVDGKKKIRVKRIRKTSPSTYIIWTTLQPTTLKTSTLTSTSKLLMVLTSKKRPKYSVNWGRYTTNYRDATPPYPLILFPEILIHKHNISNWGDPRHTEWFKYFGGLTERTIYHAYTLRVYPFKRFFTVYEIPARGELNKIMRNYAKTTPETNPPHWIDRKYWIDEEKFSEGPFRAYRRLSYYDERNISCKHEIITNTQTPYTGSPCIAFFDCDQMMENRNDYGYDDSELYEEDAQLQDKYGSKYGSNTHDSLSSDNVDQFGPDLLLKGKEFEPDDDDDDDDDDELAGLATESAQSVENLEVLNNLTEQKIANREKYIQELRQKMAVKSIIPNETRYNTTVDVDFGSDSDFEYMLPHYLNEDTRTDIVARKYRRRQIRTHCAALISTIKKKMNTLWWKTFWKETATAPSKFKVGKSTPWYRMRTLFDVYGIRDNDAVY